MTKHEQLHWERHGSTNIYKHNFFAVMWTTTTPHVKSTVLGFWSMQNTNLVHVIRDGTAKFSLNSYVYSRASPAPTGFVAAVRASRRGPAMGVSVGCVAHNVAFPCPMPAHEQPHVCAGPYLFSARDCEGSHIPPEQEAFTTVSQLH